MNKNYVGIYGVIKKKPKFDVGDKVRLIKYPNERAIVRLIIWHKKDRRIYYILDVEGNKKEVIVGIMRMRISLKK